MFRIGYSFHFLPCRWDDDPWVQIRANDLEYIAEEDIFVKGGDAWILISVRVIIPVYIASIERLIFEWSVFTQIITALLQAPASTNWHFHLGNKCEANKIFWAIKCLKSLPFHVTISFPPSIRRMRGELARGNPMTFTEFIYPPRCGVPSPVWPFTSLRKWQMCSM